MMSDEWRVRADERYNLSCRIQASLGHEQPGWWRPFARATHRRAVENVHRTVMKVSQEANMKGVERGL